MSVGGAEELAGAVALAVPPQLKKGRFLLNSNSSLFAVFSFSGFGWKDLINLCIQAADKAAEAGLSLRGRLHHTSGLCCGRLEWV